MVFNKKQTRAGINKDIEMANYPKISPKWFPDKVMFENSRLNVKNGQKISDLFTKRALVALSLLYEKISNIKDDNLRNVFEIVFSGSLSQSSKMVFVINRNKKNKLVVGRLDIGFRMNILK